MAGTTVTGDLYQKIDGKLGEIKRQLRQKNGYPFDPLKLDRALQALIEGRFQGELPVVSVFSLRLEGTLKTSELVKLGRYDWFNDLITDERFPIQQHAPLDRTIELFEFDHDPSNEEVLEGLKRRGLERPTYEDALCFGIKYLEEQRKRPIVFFHEPLRGSHGGLYVLVLGGTADERRLNLHWLGRRWPRHYVFAGVRKLVA